MNSELKQAIEIGRSKKIIRDKVRDKEKEIEKQRRESEHVKKEMAEKEEERLFNIKVQKFVEDTQTTATKILLNEIRAGKDRIVCVEKVVETSREYFIHTSAERAAIHEYGMKKLKKILELKYPEITWSLSKKYEYLNITASVLFE